jgi:glycosyltransferase involved in cell wall biosynthesis
VTPDVTVLMAAFNAQDHVGEAVESVLTQKGLRTQLVVVDDGSTDRTGLLLDGLGNKADVIHQVNQGAAVARNRALREARGRYIVILDADDRLPEGSLEVRATYLDSQPRAAIVYGDTRLIDAAGSAIATTTPPIRLTPNDWAFPAFVTGNLFSVHAAMCRAAVFQEDGVIHGDEVTDAVGDWALWARLSIDHRMAYRAGVVAEYRQHPQMSLAQLTRDRGRRQTAETLRRIIKQKEFTQVPLARQRAAVVRALRCYVALREWGDAYDLIRLLLVRVLQATR